MKKEKYKNDKIIKYCLDCIEKINKIKKDYDNINEKEYQGLISNIENMIESRLIYLYFWED